MDDNSSLHSNYAGSLFASIHHNHILTGTLKIIDSNNFSIIDYQKAKEIIGEKNNTIVSGNAGDEKNLLLGDHKKKKNYQFNWIF